MRHSKLFNYCRNQKYHMGSQCVSLFCLGQSSLVHLLMVSCPLLWFLIGFNFENHLLLLSLFSGEGGKEEMKNCGVFCHLLCELSGSGKVSILQSIILPHKLDPAPWEVHLTYGSLSEESHGQQTWATSWRSSGHQHLATCFSVICLTCDEETCISKSQWAGRDHSVVFECLSQEEGWTQCLVIELKDCIGDAVFLLCTSRGDQLSLLLQMKKKL